MGSSVTPPACGNKYRNAVTNWPLPISMLVLVRSFIEPDLFENNVAFDNTTPIYLIICSGN